MPRLLSLLLSFSLRGEYVSEKAAGSPGWMLGIIQPVMTSSTFSQLSTPWSWWTTLFIKGRMGTAVCSWRRHGWTAKFHTLFFTQTKVECLQAHSFLVGCPPPPPLRPAPGTSLLLECSHTRRDFAYPEWWQCYTWWLWFLPLRWALGGNWCTAFHLEIQKGKWWNGVVVCANRNITG